jgi:TolB-like protein/DNA-binding winged helix-turn-helix (wHTH) protein/Tfp pilus assembly protein PilF
MAESARRQVVRFGPFQVDLKATELRKNGRKVKLQEKPFQLLVLLLDRAGEVVEREALRNELWPADTFVNFDHSLGTAMGKLRLALGDSAAAPRFIETLPRRGFRFIARVSEDTCPAPTTPVSPEPASAIPDRPTNGAGGLDRDRGNRVTPLWRRWRVAFAPLAIAPLALLLLLGITPELRDRLMRRANTTRIRSIAVLPFENLSRDPAQEYFTDGMTDELITSLARIRSLRVISRTSSMLYKGSRKPLAQIARELNVDAVLEGSVRRSGSRVRLTAQLIRAPEETHLWADSFEHDGGDLLTLQTVLARVIANAIEGTAAFPHEAHLSPARHVDPGVYEAYLKGRYYWNRASNGDMQRARDYFEQAVRKDPNNAPAYAWLADCFFRLGADRYLPASEAYANSRQAALQALANDESLGEAHVALARVLFQYDWDWVAAEREFSRGIELSPSSAPARTRYAYFLMAMGRTDEALAQGEVAYALDPASHVTGENLAELHYYSRQFDEAIAQWRKTLELYPDSANVHFSLARVFWKKGLEADSRHESLRAEQLWGADEKTLSIYRSAYDRSGMSGFWRKELELAHCDHPFDFAILHAQLGENDQAFQWLEKAYAEREYRMVFLKVHPLLDGLHADPRFRSLVQRVGLPI